MNTVDAAATVFVDVMRLANVAGGEAVRIANERRYAEFVDMADEHLSELRAQITRLSAETPGETLKACAEVERSVAWAITRLRRGPALDRSWIEFVDILAATARRIEVLINPLGRDYYHERVDDLLSSEGIFPANLATINFGPSSDEFVRIRHIAQSRLVEYMIATRGTTMRGVRDDIDRQLAMPYFAIDLRLLSAATSANQTPG